jgi:hypothetical protein
LQYFNNILCVKAGWLIDEGIISKSNYNTLKHRGWLKQMRRASKGNPALIAYDSIPDRFKDRIKEILGEDPYKITQKFGFRESIKPDEKARIYFSEFKLPDGDNLPPEKQLEYTANATILNAVHKEVNRIGAKRRNLGGSTGNIWENVAKNIEDIRNEYGHTLPSNVRRLRDKLKNYLKNGYDELIHKGYCNTNSRKVNDTLEDLLLSLYAMPNKPYSKSVYDMYWSFISGDIDVVDYKTGELYNRSDFYKNGQPVMISESTVWNYINNPKNRILVDKVRTGGLEFQTTHRPHHHRKSPEFSLSKISLDDRDLPRKMHNGNRVKAYYVYDVASKTCIGASYSHKKDTDLFINCLRDMLRNLLLWGLNMPMEAEVEHHIVNQFKDDLFAAGTVFPFVRWCNPGNSQEKRAEHLNREKKYGFEKRYQDGIGRFYSKLEANRPKVDKVADETNEKYNDKRYTFDELVADDLKTIEDFNNSLHPNQKKYPGLTRMQVLVNYQNPDAPEVNEAQFIMYIGEHTPTSIRRSQYVRVQYANYSISSPQIVERLKPNNYEVDAYYIPDINGVIDKVYLFQNNRFIDTCGKIERYNEATAEHTDIDRLAFKEQSKYVKKFDTMIKTNKVKKVAIVENTKKYDDVEAKEVEAVEYNESNEFDFAANDIEYYKQRAIDDL